MLPSIKKGKSFKTTTTTVSKGRKMGEKFPQITNGKPSTVSSSENSTIEDSDDSSDNSYVTDVSDDDDLNAVSKHSILNRAQTKSSFKNSSSANKKSSIKFADAENEAEEKERSSPFKYTEKRHRKSLGKVVTFKAEKKPYYMSPFYRKELEIRDVDMNRV